MPRQRARLMKQVLSHRAVRAVLQAQRCQHPTAQGSRSPGAPRDVFGTWHCEQGASPSRLGLPIGQSCSLLLALLSFCFLLLLLEAVPSHFSACSWNAPCVLVLLKLGGARAAPGQSCGPPASLSCFLERETKRCGLCQAVFFSP